MGAGRGTDTRQSAGCPGVLVIGAKLARLFWGMKVIGMFVLRGRSMGDDNRSRNTAHNFPGAPVRQRPAVCRRLARRQSEKKTPSRWDPFGPDCHTAEVFLVRSKGGPP